MRSSDVIHAVWWWSHMQGTQNNGQTFVGTRVLSHHTLTYRRAGCRTYPSMLIRRHCLPDIDNNHHTLWFLLRLGPLTELSSLIRVPTDIQDLVFGKTLSFGKRKGLGSSHSNVSWFRFDIVSSRRWTILIVDFLEIRPAPSRWYCTHLGRLQSATC